MTIITKVIGRLYHHTKTSRPQLQLVQNNVRLRNSMSGTGEQELAGVQLHSRESVRRTRDEDTATESVPAVKVTTSVDSTSNVQKVQGEYSENLSKRAKRRLLRKKAEKARIAAKKLARRENKSTSPSKQLTSVNKDYLEETDYYFEKGLRKVYPYYFTFSSYAKGRWFGRSLEEIFSQEFGAGNSINVTEMIESGQVQVNGKTMGSNYKLKPHDFVQNTLHRHEVPVTADHIEIIKETDDILVVNKPSSIPIHPCGNYRHNSVTFILAKEYGYRNLRLIHRLDRLTSGVCIFCKTEAKNMELHDQMKNRQVHKEYICRVEGQFPEGTVECKEPIDVLCHKLGLFKVGPSGKAAHTTFHRLGYHGNTSVVKCEPHTGRTHQIRIHLQYLGYPIVNDPLYNGDVWGPEKGKDGHYGKSEEQLIEELFEMHQKAKYETTEDSKPQHQSETATESEDTHSLQFKEAAAPCSSSGVSDVSDAPSCKRMRKDEDVAPTQPTSSPTQEDKVSYEEANRTVNSQSLPRPGFDQSKVTFDPKCTECQKKFQNPSPEDLVMYLHAYKYKGPTWEYSTELPSWAQDDWQPG